MRKLLGLLDSFLKATQGLRGLLLFLASDKIELRGIMALGQVMLDLEGLALTQEEAQLLCHPQVGGIILFSRNYQSPAQLSKLIAQIRAATPRRLLLAVDQEGGRVQRFREGFTQLPPLKNLGILYDTDPLAAKQLAHSIGWLMASELLAYDLDFSFAPVLDVDTGISSVIGDRGFHASPQIVAELGQAFCAGMQYAGMATVGKHFPGHGSVAADSHIDIPVDDRDYTAIEQHDLIPFRALAAAHLDGIMPAHVIYSKLDKNPAGFSSYWLQTVLRQGLNFQGAIFSDDLAMAGAEVMGNFANRARSAINAGCDMVLVCNNRPAALDVLAALADDIDINSQQRLLKMQATTKVSLKENQQHPLWQQTIKQIQQLTSLS